MDEKIVAELYNSIVNENLKLYKTFFESNPSEEGIIEYWKNAIRFYSNLSLSDKDILFSIIQSTMADTISNMLAVTDGNNIIGNHKIELKIDDKTADDLQDAFLAYIEDNSISENQQI